MLDTYLNIEDVRLQNGCNNWEEMIRETGQLMLERGYIKQSYIEAMVKAKRIYGAYMVIVPGVALFHARPEDGVRKTGLVFLTTSSNILFDSENDPVKIGIGFAATKPNDHLEILAELAGLLENEMAIKRISNFVRGEEEDFISFLIALKPIEEDC